MSLFLIGCGGGGGGTQADAPPNVPAMITVTGTASARSISGAMGVAGVTVGAFKNSDDSMVTMATTDAQGNYTLTITTNGQALDGYIKATITGYLTTYLYPPYPLTADFAGASINLLTTSTRDLLSTLAKGNQMAGMGLLALEVTDGTMTTVAGAMVSSSPAGSSVHYDGTNGLPDSTVTMTAMDGVAYIFNVPPGSVTVSATGSMAFKSHSAKAYADQFTTTLIVP